MEYVCKDGKGQQWYICFFERCNPRIHPHLHGTFVLIPFSYIFKDYILLQLSLDS